MIHVVPEHALRVLVTNLSKFPAAFSVSLTDPDGGVAAEMTTANVVPGATAWATFPSSATADVRPAVDGPDGSRALVTAELFEEATGEVVTMIFLDVMGY